MKYLLLLASLPISCSLNSAELVKKHLFLKQKDNSYQYHAREWSLSMEPGKGWTSLIVDGHEFLDDSTKYGAALFQTGEKWTTWFPGKSLISNSEPTKDPGRLMSVDNGVFLFRLIPAPRQNRLCLYAGANQKENFRLILFFNDQIAFLRDGDKRRLIPSDRISKVKSLVVVHKNGAALYLPESALAGKMKDPSGNLRWALVLNCVGFKANTFDIFMEVDKNDANWVDSPSFKVISSDDPTKRGPTATTGVINPIYTPKTKLDFNITFKWLKETPFNGAAELEIDHSLGERHFYQEVKLRDITPDKNGYITVHFNPKFKLPGVSEVRGRLYDADGKLIWGDRYRMLYDLDRFKPNLVVEKDQKQFWDNTLKDLKAVPLEPETIRVEKYKDHPVNEIYDVTFNTLGGRRVHAMLFVPKKRFGPLPAVVTAHPGIKGFRINKGADGVYGSKEYQKNSDAVTIIPLIRGHEPDASDIPFNQPWWGPLDSRDDFCAREWYCDMVRAVDYLATRPDIVDMDRVVAAGGSQGGALALVTAALDPRIKYCFAMCPAACQFHEMLEHYESFGPSKGQVPEGQTLDDLKTTLSYYDAVNFCPWIKCPTYIGVNVGDLTVHSMGGLAAFKNLSSLADEDKDIFIGYTYYHGASDEFDNKKDEIMKALNDGK